MASWIKLQTTNNKNYLISLSDFDKVASITWTRPKDGYIKKYLEKMVNGKRVRSVILQHRLVMGAKHGELIDHINGDTADNRRENLRIASKSLNALNTQKTKGAIPYRGVIFNKKNNKYQAVITIMHKKQHLGFFSSADAASDAYQTRQMEVICPINS